MYQLPHFPGSEKLRGTPLICAVAFICGCGFLLFGYDQGVMSALIEEPNLAHNMPKIAKYENGSDRIKGWHNPVFDDNIQGAIVSCYELGAMIGSFIVLWQGDNMGRRMSVVLGSIIMIIGTAIMVCDTKLGPFTVGRVVAGVGNGLNTATIPILQSELSRAKNRGLLVFIEGALLAGGVMISYWIDFGFYWLDNGDPNQKKNTVEWRFPIGFQGVFAVVLLLGMFIVPESPRWLIKKGENEIACQTLSRLQDKPLEHEDVQVELRQLMDSIQKTESILGKFSYREIFTNGPEQNLYRTCVACCSQMFQQLSGINNLTYYANTVFNMFEDSDTSARLLVCGSGVLYFVAASVAVFVIDFAGRRRLMMGCAFGMMVCMAILSGAVHETQKMSDKKEANGGQLSKEDNDTLNKYGKLASAFVYLYFVPWSMGWLGMTWLYPPEVTPIRIRAPAAAMSTITNWLWNFTVVMISPPAFKSLRNHTFTMFGAFNLMFIPFVYMFFPETRQRGLEEMDLFFAEAHDTQFWKKSHFMTYACYLSTTKPYLTTEEIDEEIAARFHHRENQHKLVNEFIEDEPDNNMPANPEQNEERK